MYSSSAKEVPPISIRFQILAYKYGHVWQLCHTFSGSILVMCVVFVLYLSCLITCQSNLTPHLWTLLILEIKNNRAFFSFLLAWYDGDLAQYQRERQECELEKVFEERNAIQQQGGEIGLLGVEPLKQKVIKEPEPEWTQSVRQKKNEDYYMKIREVRVWSAQVVIPLGSLDFCINLFLYCSWKKTSWCGNVRFERLRISSPFLGKKLPVSRRRREWPKVTRRACKCNFYYASISSLSLGAPFRYVSSKSVALSLSLLSYYDACATLPQGEVARGR